MRRTAIDRMRGLVMMLMTLDHASLFFNAGRVSDDGAGSYVAGSALALDQFLTRWVTHLCAPTFLFLAGTALALSTDRRVRAGQSAAQIDRDLIVRGAIIVGLDLGYMSMLAQHLMLQVLYAIGMSMLAMVALRRLPNTWLLVLALGWFVAGEAITSLVWNGHNSVPLIAALTVAPRFDDSAWIIYPCVPWLAMMLLGWVFGGHLITRDRAAKGAPTTLLIAAGISALIVFAAVRSAGGYGNMFLQAENSSLAQFLHVSKYPPGLTYATLELGIMALLLAGFMALDTRGRIRAREPLLVFGQTALFFYLMHFTILGVSSRLLGGKAGLARAYVVAVVLIVALYPLCILYRRYKQAHPESWVRFF